MSLNKSYDFNFKSDPISFIKGEPSYNNSASGRPIVQDKVIEEWDFGVNYNDDDKKLSFNEIYSDGMAYMDKIISFKNEPDPSIAVNYWEKHGGLINSDEFVYPKDDVTGKSLGIWPKDYDKIPTKLTDMKLYEDKFIWPATPVNGKYIFVYEHKGIDIMAKFGTPIYSPVDGKIVYSTWGDTKNKGTDETAYSINIILDDKVNINGKTIDKVYLTHMCGIVYRVEEGAESIEIKKGDLIGFVGNATGNATSKGWGPHLHMSMFEEGYYDDGLRTSEIERLYDITSNQDRQVGE